MEFNKGGYIKLELNRFEYWSFFIDPMLLIKTRGFLVKIYINMVKLIYYLPCLFFIPFISLL